MQHDILQKKKLNPLFPSRGRKHVKGSNICFHCVLCFIPVYMKDDFLIRKKTFDPIKGVNGICNGILFAKMLLYIPFPFICYATRPYSRNDDVI